MRRLAVAAFSACLFPAFALAQNALTVTIDGLKPGGLMSPEFAYCAADAENHTRAGGNLSPAISWTKGPDNTKSYAVIMHDPDVPVNFSPADKEGETIPADAPRRAFYHWVLVDIPPSILSLSLGRDSNGVYPNGKPVGRTGYGVRGKNDYSGTRAFGGYDGPCPPWNDLRMHHYVFTVYALDEPSLSLQGDFDGRQAIAAMQGHVLAQGSITGTYTQNPSVK